jgi:hypothetical protein
VDKLIDSSRELPTATGVIPVKTFLNAVRTSGYDRPAHAESFNAALRELPRDEPCAATAAAMKKAIRRSLLERFQIGNEIRRLLRCQVL